MTDQTRESLDTRLRRLIFRALFNSLGRGASAQRALMDELRRSKNGSLGLIHRKGDDWLVDCGDHLIWCAADDALVSASLVKHGAWQRADFDLAIATLGEHGRWRGGAFIDVGANIGTHTVYAGLRDDISRILAFEPEARNFDLLCRNVAVNDLGARVEAQRLAVSDRTATLNLAVSPELQGMHAITEAASGGTVSVEARPLDDLVAAAGIAPAAIGLVWIDVEGHELSVFRGMTALLSAGVPVFFEYSRGADPDAWRALIPPAYAHAFVVRPEGVERRPLAAALEIEFGDLLIF